MMLRRLKDDVEKNLAPKEETIIEVEHVLILYKLSNNKKLLLHSDLIFVFFTFVIFAIFNFLCKGKLPFAKKQKCFSFLPSE